MPDSSQPSSQGKDSAPARRFNPAPVKRAGQRIAGWYILKLFGLLMLGPVFVVFRYGYLASIMAFAVILALAILWDKRRERLAAMPWASCPSCGYDLGGLARAGVCPEYGNTYALPTLRRDEL